MEDENEILKLRCRIYTKGKLCPTCTLDCEYREILENGGQCVYEDRGYDK